MEDAKNVATTMKEDGPSREEFFFKGELEGQINDQTKRCIKNILRTVEIIIPNRESPEFKHMRKAVLDAVNELNREIQERIERMV